MFFFTAADWSDPWDEDTRKYFAENVMNEDYDPNMMTDEQWAVMQEMVEGPECAKVLRGE